MPLPASHPRAVATSVLALLLALAAPAGHDAPAWRAALRSLVEGLLERAAR